MADMTLDQWKAFLSARLQQESGKDAEALQSFDKLLAIHPNNSHLQSSRAFALERLNRQSEAAHARIVAAYSKTAAALIGEGDTPEAWTAELKGLISEIDSAEKGRSISAALVAW